MTASDRAQAILKYFQELTPADRKSLLNELGHVAVPEGYGGFFIDPGKPADDQRSETLFELDGLVNAQSTGFMVEMIPLMYPFLDQLRGRERYLEALDVGCRTGAGTALMADLFMSYHSGLATYFDTIDIDPTFAEYQQSRWSHLRQSLVGDIADVAAASYDYLICSHTIEHLADPGPFCRELQRVARDYVFIFCPFEEYEPIDGHHTITKEFVASLEPIHTQVLKSWWWRHNEANSDVVFFVLKGAADPVPTQNSEQMMQYDLVWVDPYYVIAIADDIWHNSQPEQNRHRSIYELASHVHPRGTAAAVDPYSRSVIRADAYRAAVAHYAAVYGSFTICDVGAHLGITAMDTVNHAIAAGGTVKAFAFDAGAASELTWRNFENNGFGDIVFERAAVGDVDGHGIMYSEPGESVGNRVILGGSASSPVRFLKLDTYLKEKGAFGPATVKIDVQGAEPGVLSGMRALLDQHPVTLMMEFTPWALRQSGTHPFELLSALSRTHHIFDLGYNRERMIEVRDPGELLQRVDSAHPYWCDVLLVPYDLKDGERFLDALQAACD